MTPRSRNPFGWVLVALTGVVVGCSSSSTTEPAMSTAGASTPDAPSPSPPARPTRIVGPPAKTIPFRALDPAVVTVANPDGIVAVGHDLWIKTDDGRAVRIDPGTNEVTGQVGLDRVSDPSRYCQGIGTDGTSMWACATEQDGTAVAQIDAGNARVRRRVPVDKLFDQLSLPADDRGIWVLTGDGSTVVVVDPRSAHTTAYPLGVACQQIAVEGDRLVATSSVAIVVVQLDTTTGTVIGRTHLPSPRIAALLDGEAWVDSNQGITRFGPDLATRAVYPRLVASAGGDVVAAAGSIWVRTGEGTIFRIDPATGQVVERLTPDRPLTGGSLYIAFGSIWTTSNDDDRVVRLRLEP